MRITLDIDERVLKQAKRRALEEGETLARFIEGAIWRQLVEAAHRPAYRLALLTKMGDAQPGVDWDNRDSFYEHMEDRS